MYLILHSMLEARLPWTNVGVSTARLGRIACAAMAELTVALFVVVVVVVGLLAPD